MVDAPNVSEVGAKVVNAFLHRPPGGGRVDGVRRHFDFLNKAGVGIFKVDLRNAIRSACKCWIMAVVHAEQGRLVAA